MTRSRNLINTIQNNKQVGKDNNIYTAILKA